MPTSQAHCHGCRQYNHDILPLVTARRLAHVAFPHDDAAWDGGCVQMIADAEVAAWDTLQNHVNIPIVLQIHAGTKRKLPITCLTSRNVDIYTNAYIYTYKTSLKADKEVGG